MNNCSNLTSIFITYGQRTLIDYGTVNRNLIIFK
jgi:hypothetical protein